MYKAIWNRYVIQIYLMANLIKASIYFLRELIREMTLYVDFDTKYVVSQKQLWQRPSKFEDVHLDNYDRPWTGMFPVHTHKHQK